MDKYDPLEDGISSIELIDCMGGDLSVVNDARASFEKVSTVLEKKDEKLINYLIEHNHTSPFRGVVFKFKIKAPLAVCRQWWKHVIASNHNDEQLGWNEKSFRYVPIANNEFYTPKEFRKQSKSNKQSSSGCLDSAEAFSAYKVYKTACDNSFYAYLNLLELGVCREQARMVLIPAIYTSWVWTVSLQALLHFIKLRKGEGAQTEIIKYAQVIEQMIIAKVPITVKLWGEYYE